MCDSESTKFLSFSAEQKTIEGAKALLNYTISSYDSENPLFILTAEDKKIGNFIGVCGLNPLKANKEIEIFYTVASDQRYKGYAVEITQSLIQYLINNHGYKKLIAFIMQANIGAQKVALNSGFQNYGLVANENFEDKVFKYVYNLLKNG
jgi:[ribosomal protein S5]-alanine N-acetyltransferase